MSNPFPHSPPTATTLHVGIAGAGLLGRLLAWRLAMAGHRISVFDPAAHAMERGAAGWTAAGMLSPIAELECADAHTARRGWRSLDLWAQWLPALPQPVDFRRDGSLLLAHRADAGSAQRLLRVLHSQGADGHRRSRWTPQRCRRWNRRCRVPPWPGCCPVKASCTRCRRCRRWPPLRTNAACTGTGAMRCRRSQPGRIDGRRFDHVFDVRGLGARPDLPLRGVRGEVLWLHAPGLRLRRAAAAAAPAPARLPGAAAGRHRRRRRHRDRKRRTARRSRCAARSSLLSAAHSVLPELAEARIVHTETNLRPALPDNLPRDRVRKPGPDAHQRPVPPRLAAGAGAGRRSAARRWR